MSGVIVNVDFVGALGFAGNFTATDKVTTAVAIVIAARKRRAKVNDRE